jgi:hypothetical protein
MQGYVTSRPISQQCIYSKPIVKNSRQSVWWNHHMEESQNNKL